MTSQTKLSANDLPSNMEAAYQKQNQTTPLSRDVWALAQLAVKLKGEDQREIKEALYELGYVVVRGPTKKLCLITTALVPENPYKR